MIHNNEKNVCNAEEASGARKIVAVFDSRVGDLDKLIDELDGDVFPVLISASEKPVSIISDALSDLGEVDELHIFAHGQPGGFLLGDGLFDEQQAEIYRDQLGDWQASLDINGSVSIYGCNTGAGVSGASFIRNLSEILNRPVAACSGAVGAFQLGGTWDLDVAYGRNGFMSQQKPFQPTQWDGLLELPIIDVAIAFVDEGTTSGDPNFLSWTISLSEPATEAVQVEFRLLSGTGGVASSDLGTGATDAYGTLTSAVTFAVGETSKTVSYRIDADNVDETDEAVILEVYSAQGAALAGGVPVLRSTGWILDDDGTGNNLALFVSRPLLIEGDDGQTQASFEVSLSRPAPEAFTVDYTTVDGSATAGEDYQATSGTLSFVAGQTSASVTVPVFGDTAIEPTELFSLSFDKPASVEVVSIGAAEILDDDAGGDTQPTVNVSSASNVEATTTGDPNYLSWTISLSEPATEAVQVEFRLLSGTGGVASSDLGTGATDAYGTLTSAVTFAVGETSKTVSYRIDADSVDETDEAVILEVYSAQGAALAGGVPVLRSTGWILDDDGTGNNLALFVSRPLLIEGDDGQTQASFEVSLSRPAPEAFTVDYTTVDGSATAGEDYQATSGTLSFVAGQTSASVTVPVFGDTAIEPTELFSLSFDKPASVEVVSIGAAEILDDDAGGDTQPTVNVSSASNVEATTTGDPNYLSWTISLSEPATEAVQVEFRLLSGTGGVASSDLGTGATDAYGTLTSAVTFAVGETSKTVSYRIDADSVDETDEAVILEVYSAQGAALAGGVPVLRSTGWILDDDGTGNNLALFVSRPIVVEGDDGQTQASFEVSLSRPAPEAFTVDYTTVDGSATAGEDYQATSGTLSFVAGQTSASVTVPVFGDTAIEPTELFSLSFDKPASVEVVSIGAAEILDDDAGGDTQPTVNVSSASNVEATTTGDPNYLSWTISLSEPATEAVQVEFRLLSGTGGVASSDLGTGATDAYGTLTSAVTFAVGETSKTVSYRIDADSVDETDEAVILEVYSAQGAALAGGVPVLRSTGWILDDDGTGNNLALFVSRPIVVEGDDGQTQASFEVSLSRPAPEAFTVDYTTVDGSATAGEDYQATSGTLSFVAGQTSVSVTVPVFGDTDIEPTELFSLSFDKPASVEVVSIGAAEILDDDAGGDTQPTVNVSSASNVEATTTGDPNYLSWTISLSEPATEAVQVEFRLLSGTGGVASSDLGTGATDAYGTLTSAVTFAVGETSKTVSYRIDADNVDETDEAVILEVYSAQGAALAGGVPVLRSTGWILDDDGTGNNLALFVEDAEVVEGPSGVANSVAVPVRLSLPADQDITLDFSTAAGTATPGVDYTETTGSVTFIAGQTVASAIIPVLGDGIEELDETFTLTVTPTAEIASGTDGATATVTIRDAGAGPVVLDLGDPATIDEGSVFSRTITFTDGEDQGSDGWEYLIDWGNDGTVDDSGTIAPTADKSFTISRAFADGPANQIVGVQVIDQAVTDEAAGTIAISVSDVPPEIALSGADNVPEDASYTLNLGTVADPGTDTVTDYVVNWGDGNQDTYSANGDVTHTYADPDDYVISVDLVDEEGTYIGVATKDISVDAVVIEPVSITVGGAGTVDEGSVFSRTITFSDGDDAGGDGWRYEIDWDGDGLFDDDTGTVASGVNSFEISRNFPDGPASATVGVRIIDESGADDDSDTFALTVKNVDPTLDLLGDGSVDQGAIYSLTLANLVDPGSDTVSAYTIDWGDGTTPETTTALGDISHVYADVANRTIIVSVTDEDGSYTFTKSIAVTEPADEPNPFEFEVTVPETLAPGTAGGAQIAYERGAINGTALEIDAALFFVTGDAALVSDPLTGDFDDQQFLLAYGDGSSDIAVGETGNSEFEVKGTGGPGAGYTVSASIIDFDAVIDWEATIDLLRPAGISDAAWGDLSALLVDRLGTTGADFVKALAEFGVKLQSFGLNGESASAALAFLADVLGDHGSIASRAAPGSLGPGWSTLADIGLVFDGDTVVLDGMPELSLLRSLDPATSAFYTVSDSASRSVALTGNVVSEVPVDGIEFVVTETGTYAAKSLTDAELVKTSDGYVVEYDGGARLLFNASGEFLKLVETDGLEITVSRDTDGAITGFAGPQGASLLHRNDARSRPFPTPTGRRANLALAFDSDGQLTSATSDTGVAEFGYDASGNLASAKAPGIDAAAIAYDTDLRLASIDYADGLQSETFTYDGVGGVTVTDGEGRSTTVDYLPGGAVGRVTDGEGNVSSLVFDADGDLIGLRAPDGTETTITFDDLGRITSLTDADGATVEFSYEGDSDAPSTFTDASDATRTFTYDAGGRIVEAQWDDGTSLEFAYDANGNLTMSENRRGEPIDYTYDSNGRLIAQSDGSSGAVAYSYDGEGRLTSAVDDRGTTSFEYDSADRITKIIYPEGRSLNYTYNDAGLRTSMTDHTGDALFYEYDDLGRLTGLDDANGMIVDYVYDTAGNLIREENGNGTVSTFTYDDANQLTDIVNAQSDGTVNSFYRYTYDAAGQRVAMESHDGTWTYGYDAIGQLTSAMFTSTNPAIADKSLVYEYDDAGNRTRVVEDGIETLYTANALNQYTSVGDATFTYDDDGNMVSKTDSSGNATYEYDLNNRPVKVVETDGTVHEHEYDVLGSRVATTVDGERTAFLLDPFGFGDVVGDYSADGSKKAGYAHGLGLTMAQHGSGKFFYDVDGVGSVGTVTGSFGDVLNNYSYEPFGISLFENEGTENRYEFNGLFGVSEDADSSSFMRARNYDSSLGRFFSEDPLFNAGDPLNLYRFSLNDPSLGVDPEGESLIVWGPRLYTAAKYGLVIYEIVNTENPYYRDALLRELASELPADAIGAAFFAQLARLPGGEIFDALFVGPVIGDAAGLIGKEIFREAEAAEPPAFPKEGPPDNPDNPDSDNGNNEDTDGSGTRGDPWLKSFDGNGFFFNAYGEFVLARSTDGEFEVQTRQLPINWYTDNPSTRITSNYSAATKIGDDKVEIQWVAAGTAIVLFNGIEIEVEVGESIAVGDGSIYRGTTTGYVVSNGLGDGMAIRIGGAYMDVYPFIDPSRAGEMQGVHGNYDGDPTNDFLVPDGTNVANEFGRIAFQELYTTFADGWRVTDETSLFTYLVDRSTADFTDLDYPAGIVRLEDLDPDVVAAASAAAIEAGLVPGTWLFETTVFDMAFTGDFDIAETSAAAPEFVFVNEDGTQTEIVTADIDLPPVVADDLTGSVDETGTVTIDVLAGASDPEGNALSLVSGSDPNGGTVTVEDGRLVFAPAPDFEGETVLTFLVRDDAGNEVEGSVLVNVAGTPDAPVAEDDTFTVAEDTSVSGSVLDDNGNGEDSDADGDALSVSLVDDVDNGTLVLNDDGSFTYTPDADFFGSDSFTYEVSDGTGRSDTATVSLSVEPVSDEPTAERDVFSVLQGTALVVPVADLLANDTDPDGDALTVTGVSGAVNGAVVLDDKGDAESSNDEVIFTPDAGFDGDAAFDYDISDGFGGVASATVDVTVTDAPNVPPTATPIDAGTVGEDGAVVSIDLLTDASAADSDGGVLGVMDVTAKDANDNTVAFGLNGSVLTVDPSQFADALNTGDNLSVNIAYNVTDGQGGSTSNTGLLVIAGLDGPFTWYIDNDNDGVGVDDPSANESAYERPDGTSEIAGDVDDADATVFPDAPEINDGKDNDQDGEIDEDNSDPLAMADAFTTDQGAELVIPVSDLLDNDGDVDGDALTVTSVSGAVNGSVVLDDKGDADASNDEVIFTPDEGFFGEAIFDYMIEDGFGGAATASVDIEVAETGSTNVITGTAGSDYLVGTDGADTLFSQSGSYDRMVGGDGADEFVFGAESMNGVRERDVIFDYEVGIDAIVLADGASVAAVRQSSGGAVIFLEGDADAIYVRGEGITEDNLTIFTDAEFDFG